MLVLAPHLLMPPRHGADILIAGRWKAFSHLVPRVDVVACDSCISFVNGVVDRVDPYPNAMRNPAHAVIRTLRRGSHYLLEKFITSGFAGHAATYLSDSDYGMVVSSYLCTATLLATAHDAPSLRIIETHNDDFIWFENIAREARDPFSRRAARRSLEWTEEFFRREADNHVFLHVTKEDMKGYAKRRPSHVGIIAPVGVDLQSGVTKELDTSEKIELLFVGSLGTRMNFDALEYFGSKFYPTIKEAYGSEVHVTVAGSRPSRRVRRLCKKMGWSLESNVSDARLGDLYRRATFAVLPFPYATGAKLKMLETMGYGVPFLATSAVKHTLEDLPWPCVQSDDADVWLSRIREVNSGFRSSDRSKLLATAAPYTWPKIAERLHADLQRVSSRKSSVTD